MPYIIRQISSCTVDPVERLPLTADGTASKIDRCTFVRLLHSVVVAHTARRRRSSRGNSSFAALAAGRYERAGLYGRPRFGHEVERDNTTEEVMENRVQTSYSYRVVLQKGSLQEA